MSSNAPRKNKKKIKQAFILAAGLGARLRPLTDATPKVMLPIAPGKPLLEHAVEWFRGHGVGDFIINLHYLPEAITSHFGNGDRFGVRIRYSDETGRLLETGGALKKAENLLDDDFFFTFGDELHFFDPEPLGDFHLKNNSFATIVLKTSDLPQNGEIGEFHPATKRIERWHARPHSIARFADTRMLNGGIYALSKKILDYIPAGVPVKFDGEIIPKALAAREAIYAFPTDEPIFDIGTPEKYELAKEHYRKRAAKNRPPKKKN